MRRFELTEGTSSKFWEAGREGSSLTVRFGRIGTGGQTQTKSFDDDAKAEAELAKLVKEKTKKGYAEVGAPAPEAKAEAAADKLEKKEKAVIAPKAPPPPTEGFLDAGKGYALGIVEGKLRARNAKGQLLGSVPKEVKDSDVGEQLSAMLEWLAAHERECLAWVDSFMLRSLPLPARVITQAWADGAYRSALENLVVVAAGSDGRPDPSRGGLLKGTDPKRGVGVVDRDGETAWIATKELFVPHPIVLEALDDWRALATELGATQGAQQLFREVFPRPSDLAPRATSIDRFAGAHFKELNHAIGAAKGLGYRASGGSATLRILEAGRLLEARFWLGEGDPAYETSTGGLQWVDDKQATVLLEAVTPIAFSEGMRMASLIYKKRVIEKDKEAA